jgi:hypothetical protein
MTLQCLMIKKLKEKLKIILVLVINKYKFF